MARRLDRAVELELEFADRPGVIAADDLSPAKIPFFPRNQDDQASRGYQKMDIATKARMALQVIPNIVTSIRSSKNAHRDFENNPLNPRIQAPDGFVREFEEAARGMGVGGIGYTTLEPRHIFRDCAVLYQNVIVLMMEMDREKIAKGPGINTYIMIHDTYARLSLATMKLTDLLRERGFGAQAGPPLGGVTVYPVLAQKANLGHLGNHGLVITPGFGPRIRLSAIYTSIDNLPVPNPDDNPHRWVADYCKKCHKCVKTCPGSAIYQEPLARPGGGYTCSDVEKCRPYFYANYGCNMCMRDCPFSKVSYTTLEKSFSRIGG